MPFSAAWETTNQRADKNSPLQNVSLPEFILRRSSCVDVALINILPKMPVENLLITLLTVMFITRGGNPAPVIHRFSRRKEQCFQQFSRSYEG